MVMEEVGLYAIVENEVRKVIASFVLLLLMFVVF